MNGCHEQHGEAWLYPPIVSSFRYMHKLTKADVKNYNDKTDKDDAADKIVADQRKHGGTGVVARLIPSKHPTHHQLDHDENIQRSCEVKLYSIEVWNNQTGELVGGELGYGKFSKILLSIFSAPLNQFLIVVLFC